MSYLGLALALAYAVFHYGVSYRGGVRSDWYACLLLLGLAALAYRDDVAAPIDRVLGWAVLLFPCYLVFQLIPLPLWLLRVASPARAQIADALGGILQQPGYASISVAPSLTFVELLRIAGYTVAFLLVRELAGRAFARPWRLALPLIVIAALQAALGVARYFAGASAVAQGSYGNRNHFAGLLEMVLPFAVLGAVALHPGRGHRAAAGPAIRAGAVLSIAALLFLGIVYSFSRMGFVAALFSLFVIAAVPLSAVLSAPKRALAIALLAFLFLLNFAFLPPDELVAQFAKLSGAIPGSGDARLPVWKDTLRLIAAYPLFGCGLGNFDAAFLKYKTAALDLAYIYTHNDYLQLLAELGAIGFLIPAALMLAVLMRALRAAAWSPDRNVRLVGLACAGALTGLLLHSLADFNMYIPANGLALSWIAGIAAGLPLPDRSGSAPSRSRLGTERLGTERLGTERLGTERPGTERPGTEHRAATVRERTWNPAFFRKFAVALGCLLVVYSSAWFVFDAFFQSDRRAERLFCRFGICDIDMVAAAGRLERGANNDAPPLPADAEEAVRREAAAPYRWSDLGEALLESRQVEKAKYCFSRALALGPNIPTVLWSAANSYFSLGEKGKAFEQASHLLQVTSIYDETVFEVYSQKQFETAEILSYGLPPDRRACQAYMRYLLREDKLPAAVQAWNGIAPRGYFDDRLAAEYVDFLLQRKNYETAAQAWTGYLSERRNGYPETNRLFNGDFELDPTGCKFDWSIGGAAAAQVTLDGNVAHSGKRSLRIQFNGTENIGFDHVSQEALLKPGAYRFQAYIRTDSITTDQGIGFRIFDRESSARLNVATEALLGTNDWTCMETTFVAPAGTRLIEVQVVRNPSRRLDNKIAGTAWIDSVRLWNVAEEREVAFSTTKAQRPKEPELTADR